MARIEKTIFISYRRKDISWALAVYQYLTSQKYDVFFDYTSIPSGDFEQIIVSNIKARAHFVLILTPTALDRCSQPGDWLRREIETAVDEKRNIIPLLFDGFNFGSSSVIEKLTGKLAAIPRYNALDIPSGYFIEAMERLRSRYLNVPLNAVIHPVSTEVRKVVQEEQVAADKALEQKKEDIEELVKPIEEKHVELIPAQIRKANDSPPSFGRDDNSGHKTPNLRLYGIGAAILLIAALGVFGINALIQNTVEKETPMPTFTSQLSLDSTNTPAPVTQTQSISTTDETPLSPASTATLAAGSTMVSPIDRMTLVYVPAGEFVMGTENGQLTDERPVHSVSLEAFWIDQTEVTNAMYAKCVNAGECDLPRDTDHFSNAVYANHPVAYVSWNDASAYCSWVLRRLPSEAEWEKAARGTEARIYPWGNEAPSSALLNYNQEIGETTEVRNYPEGISPYGAYDMAGNVWEWVSSLYLPYPYDNNDGRENLNSLEARVHRGGSFYDDDSFIYSARRDKGDPSFVSFNLGFRCASSE